MWHYETRLICTVVSKCADLHTCIIPENHNFDGTGMYFHWDSFGGGGGEGESKF